MEKYNSINCPVCNKELSSDWCNYRIKNYEDKNPIYQCPYCASKIKINDCIVSAVDVTGCSKDSRFVIVKNNKVVGNFSYENVFQAGNKQYLHIPEQMLKGGSLYSIPITTTDEEFENGKGFNCNIVGDLI